MVTATGWEYNAGMDYLTNESKFNLINASMEAYRSSTGLGSGIASLIIFLFIPLIAGFIIFLKTENMALSGTAMLLLTFAFDFYNLFNMLPGSRVFIYRIIWDIVIVGVGLSLIFLWRNRS